MSKDLAIGIVIGGAVSSTFGSAINQTQRSVEGLQGKLGNTKGLQSLVGETQRLQQGMEQADRASRRIGLEGVRALRSEVGGLEKDWQGATARVGSMAKELAGVRAASAGRPDLSGLEAESQALGQSVKQSHAVAEEKKQALQLAKKEKEQSAGRVQALRQEYLAAMESAKGYQVLQSTRQAQSLAAQKKAAWQSAKKENAQSGKEVLALKAEHQAALLAAKGQKALQVQKQAQIAVSKEAAAAESKLAKALEATQQEAKRAKQAFEAKRATLQNTKNELKQQAQALNTAKRASSELGATMKQTAVSQRVVADSALRSRLGSHIGQLRQAGVAVKKLDQEYVRLGHTARGLQLQDAGKTQMHSGAQLGRTAAMGLATAAIPTKISGDYQAEVRDIAIKAGVAGQGGEKELDAAIRMAAQRQRMAQSDLAVSINGLVSQGMDWREAVGYGDLLGKLTIGQKMEAGDAAQLIYALQQNGVNQGEMEKVMGEIAVAGDLGAFEADKMAKFMPELLATVGSMGMQGPDAVRYLAASLQAQIKLTGNADSAANNFKNLLSKIIAPDSNKKFADAGIDLQGSMESTMRAHGDGPVAAFMRLTENLATSGDATRAKKLADIKARIKNSSGDKKSEEEALSAYMQAAGLGEVLSDMQARSAALAQIKYGKQIQSDLKQIQQTDGVKKLDTDKSKRDETSNRKWDVVASEFSSAMVTIGDAIRPVTDWVAGVAAGTLKLGATVTSNHPGVALTALAAGVGVGMVALKRVVAGAGSWAVGKALEKAGSRLPGLGQAGKGGPLGLMKSLIGGVGPDVQKVFVTNQPGGGLDLPGRGKGAAGAGAGKLGRLARVGGAFKRGGRMLGKAGGAALAVGTAGYMAYDTYKNAKTSSDKGEGYGGAAGALGGGLAGAKMGAVIGTLIAPGIGTAIGGFLGGAIGALGGEKIGGLIGKAIAGTDTPKPPVVKPPVPVTPVVIPAPSPAPVMPPAKVIAMAQVIAAPVVKPVPERPPAQVFTFNPTIQVTVKGDVKNPQQIATEIAPYLKRIFDGWQQQVSRSAMYDPIG